jgi:hypothetical protein
VGQIAVGVTGGGKHEFRNPKQIPMLQIQNHSPRDLRTFGERNVDDGVGALPLVPPRPNQPMAPTLRHSGLGFVSDFVLRAFLPSAIAPPVSFV